LTTAENVVIINNNMKQAIKHQITITQYDDDDNSVGVEMQCPDAITAYGLLAYGQWQINERLNELISNDKASND
jgi:hypothetical protein